MLLASKSRISSGFSVGRRCGSSRVMEGRDEGAVFDAILVTKLPVGTITNLIHNARKSLIIAVNKDELHLRKGKDNILV